MNTTVMSAFFWSIGTVGSEILFIPLTSTVFRSQPCVRVMVPQLGFWSDDVIVSILPSFEWNWCLVASICQCGGAQELKSRFAMSLYCAIGETPAGMLWEICWISLT